MLLAEARPAEPQSGATLMDSGVEFVAIANPHANKLTIHILAAVAQHEPRHIRSNDRFRGQQRTRYPQIESLPFVTRTGPQPAISWLQIFVVRPYSGTAPIAVPRYGTLAFRGVQSDHRGLVGG